MLSVLVLRKLRLENNVTLRPFGDIPGIHAAFDRKMIAGMISTVVPKSPFRALANAADLDIPYSMSIFAVSRSFRQNNGPLLERIIKAYIDGVATMVSNKALAKKYSPNICSVRIPHFSMSLTASFVPTRSGCPGSIRVLCRCFWNSIR